MIEQRSSIEPRGAETLDIQALAPITIDEANILRIHGYRDPARIRPAIKKAASMAARETESLIQPAVFTRRLGVSSCENGVLTLDDGAVFQNEGFDRFLDGVEHVVVFVLTMGHPLDQAVKDYIADDQLLNALFLETAGWLGIEAATKRFSIELRKQARIGEHRLSPRLGPGYSYKLDGRSAIWPLEQQQVLFRLFEGHVIDVQLLESCAMLPKISRSGLYGFLRDTTNQKG